MILARLLRSPSQTRLLPAEKLHGPTVAVMAIMTFAMMVIAAAGLALANAAGLVSSGIENRYVLVIPAGAETDAAQALAAARSQPQVRSAAAVPEAEMRRTLERWMGQAASSAHLPVPALVTVELEAGADPAPLAASLARRAPGARFVAQSTELEPLLSSIRALQWTAVALVLLIAAATAAAIVLAARGALDTHRSTIDIMHGIGATDRQLVQLFERKIAMDALAGAASGALAAIAALLFIAGAGGALAGELAAASLLAPLDLVILALVPIAAVMLAVLVARSSLFKALRATL